MISDGHTLDYDPFIPTGVPATPERVAELLAEGVIDVDTVALLGPDQQPLTEADAADITA